MDFVEGPREQREGALPALSNQQLLAVAGYLTMALHQTFMAYGHGIGADRIHELEAFGQSLLAGIKNGEIRGMDMAAEPAIIEAVHTLVSQAIPKVERLD